MNEIITQEQANQIVPQATNILQNVKQLKLIEAIATKYANSDMVPANYKNRPENCFVAVELASRMDVSPILVMQNLYIVQGKPSWAGQACKALIDGCGKFSNSEYIIVGEPGTETYGCFLQALNVVTGKTVRGTVITMQMAHDEGWLNKNGSKWKTMPEQMLKYRAAAFFARTECPEVLMGYQTADEIEDVSKPQTEKVTISIGNAPLLQDE